MSQATAATSQSVGHSDMFSPVQLHYSNEYFPVTRLDDYSFNVMCSQLAESFDPEGEPATFEGELVCENNTVPVRFRLRRVDEDSVRASFYDLSIADQKRLARFRDEMNETSEDELHSMSYDDLARGEPGKVTKADRARQGSVNEASTAKKFFAMLFLLGTMVGIGVWILFMIQSRSTIAVNNSVIVGNYYPVNTPFEGELTEVVVDVGEAVTKGQTVARVYNPTSQQQLRQMEAKLVRAEQEAVAYRQQLTNLQSTFDFAKQKISGDRKVAEAEMSQFDAEVRAAKAQVDRLQPLLEKKNIPLFEYEEAEALLAAAESRRQRQLAIMEKLELSERAALQNVMVTESQVTNPLSDLATNVALAEAAITEMRQNVEVLRQQGEPVELTAPADGTVYAVYRHAGEFLKASDELLAVSVDKGGWATGHVSSAAATGVRPGQEVEIEIPSMGISAKGKVEGVGHRSVYGRGGYTADFRGGPLEVPIRVAMDLDDQVVPSGLRLNMTVRVRDHVKEFRQWMDSTMAAWMGDESEEESKVRVASR